MASIRNKDWEFDQELQTDLDSYTRKNYKRCELLDFMRRKYPQYAWSLRSLDRRMRHFRIFYTDNTIGQENLEDAIREELNGPGQLLGYRAMHKKIRDIHKLKVPRKKVYDMMREFDPEGLASRGNVGQRRRGRQRNKAFTSAVS